MRSPLVARLSFIALAALLTTTARSTFAATTLGLYADASGSSCSFSGNDPGLVTAFVVVRPDAGGVVSVRFSAPVPACLGASWLGEVAPFGVSAAGNSQAGIVLTLDEGCSTVPKMVLQTYYYRTGTTNPCCGYPLEPFSGLQSVEVTTCNLAVAVGTSVTAHFNANDTCPCNDEVAPMPPAYPNPADTQSSVSQLPTLTWVGQDWDNDITGYDLYFGTSPSPPLLAAEIVDAQREVGPLALSTIYYWRVVARDAQGHETSGPVWRFTTRAVNHPPEITYQTPPTNSFAVSINPLLAWNGHDSDGDPIYYDVYFGSGPAELVLHETTQTTYLPGPLEFGTFYYWSVYVTDKIAAPVTLGPFYFRTRFPNTIPDPPSNPAPGNNTLNNSLDQVLSWNCTDPDVGDVLTCDLYFGTNADPPLLTPGIAGGNGHPTWSVGPLNAGTRYYWKVVVRDQLGQETTGDVWTFGTGGNHAPTAPANLSPADNSTNQPLLTTFHWSPSVDPDGGPIVYDLWLGLQSPQPAFLDLTDTSLQVGLEKLRTYRWKVVARDQLGSATSGPTWALTTRDDTLPTVPSNPYPPDGSIVHTNFVTLTWTSTDPDGPPEFFVQWSPPVFPYFAVTQTASVQLGPLQPGQTYTWHVSASQEGPTTDGPVWSFTVADQPLAVSFSRFVVDVAGRAARMQWQLESDETMQSYTVLRRTKGNEVFAAVTTSNVDESQGEYLDRTVEGGRTYQYQVLVRTPGGGEFRSQTVTITIPLFEVTLGQNHPNPFNPQTTIPYFVPPGDSPSRVRLIIYDTQGRAVRTLVNERQAGGEREVVWTGIDERGQSVSSGIYFCVLQVGHERRTQKMVLLK